MNKKKSTISPLAKYFEMETLKVELPHSKRFLTTRLGRFVDGISYSAVIIFAFMILVFSSAYFYLILKGNGIELKIVDEDPGLIDAIYFSIVTFTSLGYGDITPQGYGRLVAGAVVLCGLISVALLIGKIASERQFSISLLLYTSDCQRRLAGFCDDLDKATKNLNESMKNNNFLLVNENIVQLRGLMTLISRYVTFHSHQARLADFGNRSALKGLCQKMNMSQEIIFSVFKSSLIDEKGCTRCIKLIIGMANITNLIAMFQVGVGRREKKIILHTSSDVIPAKKVVEDLREWAITHRSPWLLSKVIALTPLNEISEWDKNIHEIIAANLGISNKLAKECIYFLISNKLVPRKPVILKIKIKNEFGFGKLFKILNSLNNINLSLEAAKFTGRSILEIFDKLDRVISEIENEVTLNKSIFHSFDSVQIEKIFKQFLRTQLSVVDVYQSLSFNDQEKFRADYCADRISSVVNSIYLAFKFGNFGYFEYLFISFNGGNKVKIYVKKMRRAPKKMTLDELFFGNISLS